VNYILGEDAHAYYSATAITAGAQSDFDTALTGGTEITNITDLTINLSSKTADITTRGATYELSAVSLKNGTITFEMVWKPADTGFLALKTAWLARSEIFFAALDQAKATTGSQGPAGNFVVTNFTRTEKIGEAIKVSVELKPSSFAGWSVKS
jgi:hypothetical protein